MGAVRENARMRGRREIDVKEIWNCNGPEEGDGAKEEEYCEEAGHAQCKGENHECLKSAFEGYGERGKSNAEVGGGR